MAEIVGYAAVTADILHIGHIIFLQKARQKCDFLWVGVMSDEYIRQVKGREPIMAWEERSEIVRLLRMVDGVIKQEAYEFDIQKIKGEYEVNVIIDSQDHKGKRAGADIIIDFFGGEREGGISSTDIRKRIYETYNSKCEMEGRVIGER